MAVATGEKSVTEQLIARMDAPISVADRRRAALHLVDWLGCAIAGSTVEAGRILMAEATGTGDVPLFGGDTADAAGAALALGALGSLYEMDDVHRTALLHPGPVVIPAALAAAPASLSGGALLDAIIHGYEAMIRIGRAVGAGHYAFFHNTATCGGFGAAMAAGKLLGLGEAALTSALGNAGSLAGGLWQCRNEAVMTKTLHCAEAARRGLTAARLAARGFTGPRFILEGPQGFFAGLCPGADPRDVLRDDDAWLIFATSFKPWPACRHAHAAIDAALLLRPDIGATPIEAITIETFADAKLFCDRPSPQTAHQAKFSLQHAVAVTLVEGAPPLAAFDPPALGRPDLVALREVATIDVSDDFTGRYPSHFGSAVTVRLKDGRTLSRRVEDALGDSENPVAEDALFEKARMLMGAAGIAPAFCEELILAALSLAEGAPLSDLRRAMAAIHLA